MPQVTSSSDAVPALERFVAWLDQYGETSQDRYDFYAGKLGRTAKVWYYRNRFLGLGKIAVLPMVFCEAFAPWTRSWYFPRTRMPIADAHFAMGFALLHQITGERRYLDRATHFLEVIESQRCPGYERHGWGYPFNWETVGGLIPSGMPLITTTPYCYEAFADVFKIDGNPHWREVMHSTAEHVLLDYQDVATGPNAATCTYTPKGGANVVNASAYRANALFSAWRDFGDERYRTAGQRNLNFVLQCQLPDGSWPYANDGIRPFVDHFHTCFVMKALAKVERITGSKECTDALTKGVRYFCENLFAEDGMPRPFARAPRLTFWRRELYDCAECINLGVLLRGRFPELDRLVQRTVDGILRDWLLPRGSFRSRQLLLGWDNGPMHRWGGAAMFHSLASWAQVTRSTNQTN